jgi:hypothetical protein
LGDNALILLLIEYIVKVLICRDNFSDGRGVGLKKFFEEIFERIGQLKPVGIWYG